MLIALYFLASSFLAIRYLQVRGGPLSIEDDGDCGVHMLSFPCVYYVYQYLVDRNRIRTAFLLAMGGFVFLSALSITMIIVLRFTWVAKHATDGESVLIDLIALYVLGEFFGMILILMVYFVYKFFSLCRTIGKYRWKIKREEAITDESSIRERLMDPDYNIENDVSEGSDEEERKSRSEDYKKSPIYQKIMQKREAAKKQRQEEADRIVRTAAPNDTVIATDFKEDPPEEVIPGIPKKKPPSHNSKGQD
jgi:hypothetical protein